MNRTIAATIAMAPQTPTTTHAAPARASPGTKVTALTSTGTTGMYARAKSSMVPDLSLGSTTRSNAIPVLTAPVAQPQVNICFSNHPFSRVLGATNTPSTTQMARAMANRSSITPRWSDTTWILIDAIPQTIRTSVADPEIEFKLPRSMYLVALNALNRPRTSSPTTKAILKIGN